MFILEIVLIYKTVKYLIKYCTATCLLFLTSALLKPEEQSRSLAYLFHSFHQNGKLSTLQKYNTWPYATGEPR